MVVWLAAAGAGAPLKKWTIDEILKVERLESPVISPDGRFVLYAMSGAVVAENRRVTDLYVVAADGSKTWPLTSDGLPKSSPRWSPDSRFVSFLAEDAGKRAQVWAVTLAGGPRVQLTASTLGVRSYAWSPDASHLAYLAAEPDSPEKIAHQKEWGIVISPEEVWPELGSLWVSEITSDRPRRLSGAMPMPASPQWSPDGSRIALLAGQPQQLHIADPAGGPPPQVVTAAAPGVHSFAWSPQGRSIAYVVSKEDPQPYANQFRRPAFFGTSSVWLVDTSSGKSRRLSRDEFPDLAELLWSRDGARLAFLAKPPGSQPDRRASPAMYIMSAEDGTARQAARGLDLLRGGLGMTWSAGDREIWFVNGERMGYNVFAADASTGELRHVTTGQDSITEVTYSADFKQAAFIRENANTKPDLYVTSLPEWKPRQITDLTPEVREFAWGPGEIIRHTSEGREIESLVVKPPDFNPSRKYPLILILHGGPTWYKKNDWRLEWEQHPIQAYAADGYCLLFPNVRGSADYGVEFRQANFRDLGGGDARDALAAVDHLIRQGFIDQNKLGVAGWSYGGFLVPAIITQTDRFKAAQFGAGIPSFEAMYSRLSTVEWIVHENYGKRPWEDAQAHIQDSPLYSAMKVKTPTLIEHGEDDPRCPVGGSVLFYKALKFYGVPTVLEIYPKEGHGIVGPLLRRRCLRRNLEWFNKWLKGDRTTSFEKVFQP